MESQKPIDAKIGSNKYGSYCVPMETKGRPASRLVLDGDIYEPDTIEFMRDNSGDGDIIHAGTFFGDFLPALSQSMNPGKVIWAFEPNVNSYDCARITIILNKLQNVELTNAGLGNSNSEGQILTRNKQGKNLGGASKILKGQVNVKGTVQDVSIVKLDDFIPKDRRISILQLDVEGFEQFAMEGALELIKRDLPIIILENDAEEEWMNSYLFPIGYSFGQKLHHNKVYFANK